MWHEKIRSRACENTRSRVNTRSRGSALLAARSCSRWAMRQRAKPDSESDAADLRPSPLADKYDCRELFATNSFERWTERKEGLVERRTEWHIDADGRVDCRIGFRIG